MLKAFAAGLLLFPIIGFAQVHQQPDAAKIKLDLKKLNTLGAVLYMAAHPDDENTRVIAYLVNNEFITTGYLSLTRGDGGQNLIGPEIRDLLGLIRTQELLSARRIDGGEQFFTRANDFGFSKSAKETFTIWDKQEIFSDVLKVIRQFKPDVILTRFPPNEKAGHGQHTVSAILAQESFDASNNPTLFPEQVKEFGAWQVSRVYTNTGRWWNDSISEKTPGVSVMNVGGYSTLLGKSASELAAESRSQHKSQGFGVPPRRGDAIDFFQIAKGEKKGPGILDGINTRWTRVKGGEKVEPLVENAIKEFNLENPSASIPILLQIRKQITLLEPGVWKTRKLKEVNDLLQNCIGLFAEATADRYWGSPGQPVGVSFEILNRSDADVKLTAIHIPDLAFDSAAVTPLKNNSGLAIKLRKDILTSKKYSGQYWLEEPHGQGMFTVNDKSLIGKPESDPAIVADLVFDIGVEELIVRVPLIYKWTDPVKGELMRPFEVVPPVLVNLSNKVYVFSDAQPRDISVTVTSALAGNVSGTIRLLLPVGWKSEPASIPFTTDSRGQEVKGVFKVVPTQKELTGLVKAVVEFNGKEYNRSLQTISYDHIPLQTLLPVAESRVLRLSIKKEGRLVAYIRGAGDEIPSGLKNMGYEVWEMKDEEVTPENLKKADAVVLGIRALNTNDRIRHFMPDLMNYVSGGGTVITQYNTNNELGVDKDKIGPYPLTLSRDRVTEENSKVRILKPDHPALNVPNKITSADFEGWVQERGLYFPGTWDSRYDALLSLNDTDEKPLDGSLLVARYGEGYYVYTGLSFFRELPEGVPGAYRLFANLVSLGKSNPKERAKAK